MSNATEELKFAATPWCDVELRAMSWVEGGRDLLLSLRLPPSEPEDRRNRLLRAHWATGLKANLSFVEKSGGYPLTWDVKFERIASKGWVVHFDFGGAGELSFRCVDLELTATS